MHNLIGKLVIWYINKCGGEFHVGAYGRGGKYVMYMSEPQKAEYARKCHTGTEVDYNNHRDRFSKREQQWIYHVDKALFALSSYGGYSNAELVARNHLLKIKKDVSEKRWDSIDEHMLETTGGL